MSDLTETEQEAWDDFGFTVEDRTHYEMIGIRAPVVAAELRDAIVKHNDSTLLNWFARATGERADPSDAIIERAIEWNQAFLLGNPAQQHRTEDALSKAVNAYIEETLSR